MIRYEFDSKKFVGFDSEEKDDLLPTFDSLPTTDSFLSLGTTIQQNGLISSYDEDVDFPNSLDSPSPSPSPSSTAIATSRTRTPSTSSSTEAKSKSSTRAKRGSVSQLERESKTKLRKQQHQQKDKERRHRINEGLKQLGSLVQSATGSLTRLDQPSIVTSSITVIEQLQNEVMAARAELAALHLKLGEKPQPPSPPAAVVVSSNRFPADLQHLHDSDASDVSCPIFTTMSAVGVALIRIRADDLCVVEANAVLAHILGYSDSSAFVGTAVWDRPLHSRLYQLDAHGRVVFDKNSNPFAGAQDAQNPDDSHIDCLWTARTAIGHVLSARVTLSVLKSRDSKPTHFLLCSLPSQRSVSVAIPKTTPNTQ